MSDPASSVSTITDQEFDAKVLQGKGPILVDFWAQWCGPCRAMDAVLEAYANKHKDITIVRMDVGNTEGIDPHNQTVRNLEIATLPFLVLYENGKKLGYQIGATDPKHPEELDEWIAKTLKEHAEAPATEKVQSRKEFTLIDKWNGGYTEGLSEIENAKLAYAIDILRDAIERRQQNSHRKPFDIMTASTNKIDRFYDYVRLNGGTPVLAIGRDGTGIAIGINEKGILWYNDHAKEGQTARELQEGAVIPPRSANYAERQLKYKQRDAIAYKAMTQGVGSLTQQDYQLLADILAIDDFTNLPKKGMLVYLPRDNSDMVTKSQNYELDEEFLSPAKNDKVHKAALLFVRDEKGQYFISAGPLAPERFSRYMDDDYKEEVYNMETGALDVDIKTGKTTPRIPFDVEKIRKALQSAGACPLDDATEIHMPPCSSIRCRDIPEGPPK